jgi:hypothetical protein
VKESLLLAITGMDGGKKTAPSVFSTPVPDSFHLIHPWNLSMVKFGDQVLPI